MIDFLYSISKFLPEIKKPSRMLTLKEKFYWTTAVLIVYFIMYHITVLGLKPTASSLDFVQMITASRLGSLLTLGIGPIVIASIFLQLFVGAELIKLDLKNPADRVKFHEVQIVLAIIIAILQGYLYSMNLVGPDGMGGSVAPSFAGNPFVFHLVAWQIAVGAIIVIFLDQIVTKYGTGSGISLFIAGGVSFGVMSGLIGLVFGPTGLIPIFAEGGAEALQNAIIAILPVVSTIIVFWAVVYGEGLKVKIPLSFGFARRAGRPLELPLFYVSNIPVIFGAAFLVAVYAMAQNMMMASDIPFAEAVRTLGGVLYLFTPLHAGTNMLAHLNLIMNGKTPILGLPEWFHAIMYVIGLSLISVMFGTFWVEMANMDAKSVAQQLYEAGINIPGFRMERRLLEKKMDEYITPLTIVGSFAVGLLASVADLTGALGTGTGILLTVGIFNRMYQQIKEGLKIYYPKFFEMVLGD